MFVELLSEIDDELVDKFAWQMNIRTYFVSDMFAMVDIFLNSFVPEEVSTKTN